MRMYDLKLYTVLSYVPNLHYQTNMCTLYVIGRLMSSLIHLYLSIQLLIFSTKSISKQVLLTCLVTANENVHIIFQFMIKLNPWFSN